MKFSIIKDEIKYYSALAGIEFLAIGIVLGVFLEYVASVQSIQSHSEG